MVYDFDLPISGYLKGVRPPLSSYLRPQLPKVTPRVALDVSL